MPEVRQCRRHYDALTSQLYQYLKYLGRYLTSYTVPPIYRLMGKNRAPNFEVCSRR